MNTGFPAVTLGATNEFIVSCASIFGFSNENVISVLSSDSFTSNFKSCHFQSSSISNHETGNTASGHHCGYFTATHTGCNA
jgi:hypothetical protein